MAEIRLRTKSELKRFVASNVKRKGWTDDMVSILIDVLWRDPFTMRTAGFYYPGGTDAIIDFDNATRTFSILPVDPLVQDFIPRYGFYSWSRKAVYHRKYETEIIELPNEEGLYAIYFAADETVRSQTLHYIKNPSEAETKDLYLKYVIISFVYWDYDNQTALYFGDDRHGSEWNPQQHWQNHNTNQAQRDSGLQIINLEINEDGSLDSHAKFSITAGAIWHDDIFLNIPEVAVNATIPILYFTTAGKPRYTQTTGFGIHKTNARIGYNLDGTSIAEVTNGYYCLYHLFASNEHFNVSRKVVSVMGRQQYEKLAEPYTFVNAELDAIYTAMPQQGKCYLGSIIIQTDDAYTNAVKARIVGVIGEVHPPVTIGEASTDFLEIDEKQVLNFQPGKLVKQNAHGFTPGDAIRVSDAFYVKAQGNTAANAQTAGIVTRVIDSEQFYFQSDGFLIDEQFIAGEEYFLSPTIAGLITAIPDNREWSVGEVRQSLGWGTPQGFKIEIDVGDEIGQEVLDNSVQSEKSVAGNGTATNKIRLVNDQLNPANFKYYGTNDVAAKGYHNLPQEAVQILTGLTPTFDLNLGRGARLTLSGNTILTFLNLKANDTGHIDVVQSTGGHTLSFVGATIQIAENSYQAAAQVKLTGIAASRDVVAYWYTGTILKIAVIKNFQ